MDLTAPVVTPVGARTHWGVGGPPPPGAREVRAPDGVLAYEPADMTVTVGAGLPFAALDAVLAEHGQEVALDPRSDHATIGGILACGLSGTRRLRHGPLRDHVLEVRFVTGYGVLVKGGGPTVKNVTGYDLPRLFVGSLGTLGALMQATLRCRPRPRTARWFTVDSARLAHSTGRRAVCGTARASTCCSKVSKPTSRRRPVTARRGRWRRNCPTAPTAVASRCHPAAHERSVTRCIARSGGARSWASAPCTSRLTRRARSATPGPSPTRTADGCCARRVARPTTTATAGYFRTSR